MSRTMVITLASAPALGDVRQAKAGQLVFVSSDAPQRKDWPRYADAIGIAIARGAAVVSGVENG